MKPLLIRLILHALAFQSYFVVAQNLHLDECQTQARQNYPQIKQLDLLKSSLAFSLENVSKAYYPQLSISGQATYQSAVTAVPIQIPGMNLPSLSKEQFRLYGELSQTIYDGGVKQQKKDALTAEYDMEVQRTESELYAIKEKVNQIYFGILLIEAQKVQTDIMKKDIGKALEKMQAALDNGTALKSQYNTLKAEDLKADQKLTELKYARQAYLEMLGLYTAQSYNENTVLSEPEMIAVAENIKRPELLVFDRQLQLFNVKEHALRLSYQPKISLFLQGGLGRPALNMLSNEVQGYYIGGLRLSIPLSGLYTLKNDKSLIENYRRSTDIQKQNMIFNIQLAQRQNTAEINKLYELMKTDDEIISLRSQIKETAFAQLGNGVITSSDYLRELNAEDSARINKTMHRIQLLMTIYKQQITTGN